MRRQALKPVTTVSPWLAHLGVIMTLIPSAGTPVPAHAQTPADYPQTTSAELWAAFVRSPYDHPNLPNVSFAGYGYSERPLPEPRVVANVRDHGARGDGTTDDDTAFQAALEAARAAGGGAVWIPEGRYRLTQPLALDRSGLVLRGEGPDQSILAFTRPISEVVRGTQGSWSGGLIWMEPGGPRRSRFADGRDGAVVVRPARIGDTTVQVSAADAARLAPLAGKMVPVTWSGDLSLPRHIAGHPSLHDYDWERWRAVTRGQFSWTWANEIVRVQGTTVTFKKPLRLEIRDGWRVTIGVDSPFITEVGVESLSIRFPRTAKAAHLQEPGYNGIAMTRVAHGFVRDVHFEHVDNAIIMREQVINCTARGFRITGRPNHHGTMMSTLSHDNLLEDFVIESSPHHGINTEGTSSGNVWRNGDMRHGTFDSHCMMSFDSVRTNITVNNTGGPGGAPDHGPFVGRRIAHWNVRVTNGKGEWISQPAILPMGAIVGIQGAPLDLKATRLWHLPDGLDKGCVVADMGQAPVPADLFEAQLRLRLGRPAAR